MFLLILRFLLFIILTVFTQTGGLIYAITWIFPISRLARGLTFIFLYVVFTYFLTPLAAAHFGRVRINSTFISTLLNRNYVRPNVADEVRQVGGLRALDASFPFLDGYPLFPHLSHNDGLKLDVAFRYRNTRTTYVSRDIPSWNGYGIHEDPRPKEVNTAAKCKAEGQWQYDLMKYLTPQRRGNLVFDSAHTRGLILQLAALPGVDKIFIEPHLKTRLLLTHPKIRFHGCGAVRHDDHLHVEFKP